MSVTIFVKALSDLEATTTAAKLTARSASSCNWQRFDLFKCKGQKIGKSVVYLKVTSASHLSSLKKPYV